MTLWAHFEKYNKEKKGKLAWKTKNFNFAKIDGPKDHHRTKKTRAGHTDNY